MPNDLQISGGAEFRKLATALGKMDKALSKALRTSVKDALNPIADAVRVEAAKFSTTIPRTITVQVQPTAKGGAKAAITARRSKMPPGKGPLPALMEGVKGAKFRHPVFADRENWVSQDAHPFLAKTVIPRLPAALKLVAKALDTAAAALLSGIGGTGKRTDGI